MKKALFFALAALPAAIALAVMCSHWVALPYWDDWGTPGEQLASWCRGTLTLSELFSQHNEHRRFFPRLLALAVAKVGGWDVRYLMAFVFAFLCLGSAGLYAVLRRTIPTANARWAGFIAMNLLLFSPRNYETLLTGSILLDLFVPSFAIVAGALVNLSARTLATKTLTNAGLALISTYTFGSGMLAWLFVFPIDTHGGETRSARILWRTFYISAALLASGAYFIGYQHPALAPPPASLVRQPLELVTYVCVWAGSLFLAGPHFAVGLVVLLLFAALSLCATLRTVRVGDWRPHYPWLLLGSYVVISGFVAARARLLLGVESASHFRYSAVTAFLYIAIVGLSVSLIASNLHRSSRRWLGACGLGATACALVTMWVSSFARERPVVREMTAWRTHLQLVLRWSLALPQNPELALLSPYPTTLATIRTLAEHDILRPRLISDRLATAVAETPNSASGSAGSLKQVQRNLTTSLIEFEGLAIGDCVVLGFANADGRWTPWVVTEIHHRARNRLARFDVTVPRASLPEEAVTFGGWAVDLTKMEATPLSAPASP